MAAEIRGASASRSQAGVDRHTFTGDDFLPVVESGGWLVALMNWSPRFDRSGWGTLERHLHSDEVFVLLKGRAVLLWDGGDGPVCEQMALGVVYNVRQSTWHNVIGTRDAQWLIVESSPDPALPTEYRPLTATEKTRISDSLPAWL
ncbi:MAG: cupin domain-containing protein [Caldilineaceae bacterium]